jgi:hypothetical protein
MGKPCLFSPLRFVLALVEHCTGLDAIETTMRIVPFFPRQIMEQTQMLCFMNSMQLLPLPGMSTITYEE